jgi:hypothetical protein
VALCCVLYCSLHTRSCGLCRLVQGALPSQDARELGAALWRMLDDGTARRAPRTARWRHSRTAAQSDAPRSPLRPPSSDGMGSKYQAGYCSTVRVQQRAARWPSGLLLRAMSWAHVEVGRICACAAQRRETSTGEAQQPEPRLGRGLARRLCSSAAQLCAPILRSSLAPITTFSTLTLVTPHFPSHLFGLLAAPSIHTLPHRILSPRSHGDARRLCRSAGGRCRPAQHLARRRQDRR